MCFVFLYILLRRINKNISDSHVCVHLKRIMARFLFTSVHNRNTSVLHMKDLKLLNGFAQLQRHAVSMSIKTTPIQFIDGAQ